MKLLDHALRYHDEGLCIIPVKPHDKAVALPTWEEYQTRMSTTDEIKAWWTETPTFNIGAVSGVNNFCLIDVDHDSGVYTQMQQAFPALFTGRIEQSGSGQGYHIPLFVQELPNLGYDNSKSRPKGNKTYHTTNGDVNIRARWCQAVIPPSIHPSGKPYTFIQSGVITTVTNLDNLIAWLAKLDPKSAKMSQKHLHVSSSGDGRLDGIKNYYPSVLNVFKDLGYLDKVQDEPNGEKRILGHGGLTISNDDARWYCFSDEIGGDVIDAFGWAKFGQMWDRYNKMQFSAVLREMKERAGIGETRQIAQTPKQHKTFDVWGSRLATSYWK